MDLNYSDPIRPSIDGDEAIEFALGKEKEDGEEREDEDEALARKPIDQKTYATISTDDIRNTNRPHLRSLRHYDDWDGKKAYYSLGVTYPKYATDHGDKILVRLCHFLKQIMMRVIKILFYGFQLRSLRHYDDWDRRKAYYSPAVTYPKYATDHGDKILVRLCHFLKQIMMRVIKILFYRFQLRSLRHYDDWDRRKAYYSPGVTYPKYATDHGDKMLVHLRSF
ncbi:hypothetical protein AVEN_100129-1 [Araneus ventricosus]|uniref:Uncharacterized protein n=1 Tax=Araneus ventricosus TaxID=182803 RepID=A0A4Y2VZE1_ARAVE|nr:hypothetical protein AVEN_100129-1 [Araneus ventricosus]